MTKHRLLALWAMLAASSPLITGAALAQGAEDPAVIEDVIVVTATRTEQSLIEVPASVSVQDVAELRRNGFTVGTDEFRGVTGVFFRRGEGDADEFAFVSFRGSTGTEGALTLVDGIPFIGLFEDVQLNQIPYDAVEQIEIVKGPVSALYGRGALYGAVNYMTRRPDTNAVTTTLTAGSDGFYRADGSIERVFGENGSFLLAGSYEDYDSWREQGQRRIFNIFAKGSYDLNEKTTLGAFINYNDRDTQLPNGRPVGPDGELLPFVGGDDGFIGFGEPGTDAQNFLAALTAEHRASDDLSFAFKGSYRDIERENFLNIFDPFGTNTDAGIVGYNGFRGDSSQEVFYGEVTARWRTGRHDIVVGITAERSDSTSLDLWTGQNGFTLECGFTFYLVEVDLASGAVLNEDNPCFEIDDPLSDNQFENAFYGAFIQNEIFLAERLRLTLGLRYDDFSRDASFSPIEDLTPGGDESASTDAFSPKAALSYLTDWGQIYFAYGRGFNSNFGANFEWNPVEYARPEQRPTTIDSIEVGIKGQFLDDRLTTEATVFYSEQKDRRQFVNNPEAETDFSAPPNLVTFGDVYRSQGVELSVIGRPTDTTTLRLNYTYLDPEWEEFIVDTFFGPEDFSGTIPVGVPEHVVYLQADQEVTDWLRFRGIFEYYSSYFYTVNNEFKDGGYSLTTLAAQLTPDFLQGLMLDLTLTNAFDESYYSYFGTRTAPSYALPGPPRQFRAAITGRF